MEAKNEEEKKRITRQNMNKNMKFVPGRLNFRRRSNTQLRYPGNDRTLATDCILFHAHQDERTRRTVYSQGKN